MRLLLKMLRRPVVWLPLLAWIGVTLLVHWLMSVTPEQRVDIAELVPVFEDRKSVV